jgi:hypothetical protein
MPPTGDEATDFRNGCAAIQAAILQTLLQANAQPRDIKIQWREPASLAITPQVAVFDVWANGRLVELEVTQQRVLASYEKVSEPALLRAIRDLAHQLTR